MKEIIFIVDESPEGGYEARSLDHSIFTDGDDIEQLKANVKDAVATHFEADGVRIDPKRMDEEYGRFAWVYDPEGNKIELWEPKG